MAMIEYCVRFCSMLGMFILCGAIADAAAAYPERPVRLIVPSAPGGGADTVARILAPKLSEVIGQPVVVDNRGGAGGSIGAITAAHAAWASGYVVQMVPVGALLVILTPRVRRVSGVSLSAATVNWNSTASKYRRKIF